MDEKQLDLILLEGESQKYEFKERLASLDKEIVGFANASGGTILLGVEDTGKILGIAITNRLKSQIVDIARNCDPSITVSFEELGDGEVLAVHVEKGCDRPYRCKEGFYLRNGPTTQKLKRDEIAQLIQDSSRARFDESLNSKFRYLDDFSRDALDHFLKLAGIHTRASAEDILLSLNVAEEVDQNLHFTNAGVLFFSKDPQRFLPESYVTAVRYQTDDRFSILDKKEFKGSPLEQIEGAMAFVMRHMSMEPKIDVSAESPTAAHKKFYDYSPVAVREALINAITHRDYYYDSSHVYVHMFSNYLEIENPGGLFRGLTLESLGKRSVRRNRLIADLLHRLGFIERVGSGFQRMEHALKENNNPPLEVTATNFFNIRFYKRITQPQEVSLTSRQTKIIHLIQQMKTATKRDIVQHLYLSEDTTLRELTFLLGQGLLEKEGIGKATHYKIAG